MQEIISTTESPYHTLRVAMKGKLVCFLKNSTRASSDRQMRELAPSAVQQRDERAAAHQRSKQRGGNAQCEDDREAADGTGTEYPQHHARNERRHVGVGDGRERFFEAGPDGRLWRDTLADLFADALVDEDIGIH